MEVLSEASIKRWKKAGFTQQQIVLIQGIITSIKKDMYNECTKKALVCFMTFALNVMNAEYWKTEEEAHEKAPKFIDELLSLINSYDMGVVNMKDMTDYIYEYSGVNFNDDFLNSIIGDEMK